MRYSHRVQYYSANSSNICLHNKLYPPVPSNYLCDISAHDTIGPDAWLLFSHLVFRNYSPHVATHKKIIVPCRPHFPLCLSAKSSNHLVLTFPGLNNVVSVSMNCPHAFSSISLLPVIQTSHVMNHILQLTGLLTVIAIVR